MNTRPPPPTGRPPLYAVAGRAFGRMNLRPVIIFTTITSAVWSLIWAGGAFHDISGDKQNNDLKKLVNFDIVIGSLYAGVAAIELYGLTAAVLRRAPMVRIYVGLSILAGLIAAAAELIRTIVHFSFKSAILEECQNESTGQIDDSSFGFWGGSNHHLTHDEAVSWCNDAYTRGSFATIVYLLFVIFAALFYTSLAYSFYRQLLDPTFFRTARAPSDQVRLAAMNSQPYGGGYVPYPNFNSGPVPSYAPPQGPPPGLSVPPYEASKLPGYSGDFADEKEKGGADPFSDHETQRYGGGPSETELNKGYHV